MWCANSRPNVQGLFLYCCVHRQCNFVVERIKYYCSILCCIVLIKQRYMYIYFFRIVCSVDVFYIWPLHLVEIGHTLLAPPSRVVCRCLCFLLVLFLLFLFRQCHLRPTCLPSVGPTVHSVGSTVHSVGPKVHSVGLAILTAVEMWTNTLSAIAAWLNASQRSWDGLGMNRSARG